MTKCCQRTFAFSRVNRRIVEACFDGGDITSDGGALLLRQRLYAMAGAAMPQLTK